MAEKESCCASYTCQRLTFVLLNKLSALPGSQVVRQRILIPPYAGSTPARATSSRRSMRRAAKLYPAAVCWREPLRRAVGEVH